MKEGRRLTELAAELERQAKAKRDFIADTRLLKLSPVITSDADRTDGVCLDLDNGPPGGTLRFKISDLGHRQIGDRVKIPAKYYDRMLEQAPELLTRNVNHWFKNAPEERMVRTLDGRTRAFLSNRYRRMDNYELVENAVLPVLSDRSDLEIASCEITENRLYLKLTTPRLQTEIKKGDIVQAGVIIRNSEVGLGKYRIDPLILRLVCMNGMVAEDRDGRTYGFSKYHVGRKIGAGEEAAAELFSDETLALEDELLFKQTRDVIKGALERAVFMQIADRMKAATENRITADPVLAVKELGNRFKLNEAEQAGIRTQLMQHEEATQYGLLNAVTRYSQEIESYDRATDLEAIGGQILTLAPGEWREIAEAAA